jgi:hypothetical protein
MKNKKLKLAAGLLVLVAIASLAACNGKPPYCDDPTCGPGNGGSVKDSVWVGPYRDTIDTNK